MSDSRLAWVDWSKFICIVLMVLCHTGMYGSGYKEIVAQLIYSFHMPAFFIISGFLFKPRSWKKTLKSFFLPILFFSLLMFVEKCCIHLFLFRSIHFSEIIDFNTYWCNSTGHKSLFFGQWFLFALLLCRFFMGDIGVFRILGRFYWVVGVISFIWVSADYYLEINCLLKKTYVWNSIVALPFFSFGMFLKRKKFLEENFLKKRLILFFSLIAILMSFINGRIDMNKFKYGCDIVLFYSNAVVASLCLFMWTSKLKERIIVSRYSTGTLAIFGSHMIIYLLISRCLRTFGICEVEVISIISTIVIVLLNYPLIFFAQKKAGWILGK